MERMRRTVLSIPLLVWWWNVTEQWRSEFKTFQNCIWKPIPASAPSLVRGWGCLEFLRQIFLPYELGSQAIYLFLLISNSRDENFFQSTLTFGRTPSHSCRLLFWPLARVARWLRLETTSASCSRLESETAGHIGCFRVDIDISVLTMLKHALGEKGVCGRTSSLFWRHGDGEKEPCSGFLRDSVVSRANIWWVVIARENALGLLAKYGYSDRKIGKMSESNESVWKCEHF